MKFNINVDSHIKRKIVFCMFFLLLSVALCNVAATSCSENLNKYVLCVNTSVIVKVNKSMRLYINSLPC